MSAYSEFTKALASDKQQPDAAFVGLLELTQAVVGAKLFTIMVYDGKLGLAGKIFQHAGLLSRVRYETCQYHRLVPASNRLKDDICG